MNDLSSPKKFSNNLFMKIDEYIDLNKSAGEAFVNALQNCNNLELVKRWAIQKYHQTYLQNIVFSAIHSNTQNETLRQAMIDQLIAEETSIKDGSDSHYNLMKRFAIACGATEDDIRKSQVSDSVKIFIDYLTNRCKYSDPMLALLSIYINEKQVPTSAISSKSLIQDKFCISDIDMEWFDLHGALDIEHAQEGKALIEKYQYQCPEFDSMAMPVVKQGVVQWNKLHDHYCQIINGVEK
ncbi:iron-containing redox enzyme family protein [Dasania sp. GY-MA-18]|uniref:Iron-containing redox enzyme family protein n=1 Tax=Dasania phycosphaerae TaxID=2950436 RepID=A0A9J6RNM2_9GAMM|nr:MULTISPECIES: iron-containing redox enzyme family protein [Dasania]MCR8923480.1 iron-containing redox enzyme family protein [Dasania sp. GY-MA-18]MCZ0865913.1 iron-containing redox enzyme family protein [Dasania phycosphaerae]MCZ0869638.1 iron-containing redox enzyme family protein [Dasania phycosphaerae]